MLRLKKDTLHAAPGGIESFTLRVKMKTTTVNCQNHRMTMELLGLRLRLEKEDLDREEQREIEERIRALETTLRMD
jgi:hypothetical protein